MSLSRGLRAGVLLSVVLCVCGVSLLIPPIALADGTPPVWGDPPPPPPPPGGGGAPEVYSDQVAVADWLGELSLVLRLIDAI